MDSLHEVANRQLEEDCYEVMSYKLPDSDSNGMAYSGIMFDIRTKNDPLEILTLEIDVRLSEVTDFNVQVYSTNGGFVQKLDDENAWTLLANVEAIPSPDNSGTIIIPHRAFKNISLDANQRISLYIHMKGAWIKNKANGLVTTAEKAAEGKDFVTYAGLGTEGLFPATEVDTTDPQFAGKIHYRKPKSCDSESRTAVYLQFVAGPSFEVGSRSAISEGIQGVALASLMKEPWFADKASVDSLEVIQNTETSMESFKNQGCPWSVCYQCTTKLTFSHSSLLSEGELYYNVFRYADAIERELKADLGSDDFLYNGMKSALLDISLTIEGLPERKSLSNEHEEYLANGLVTFFQDSTTRFVTVFDSEVSVSDFVRNLRYRRDLSGSVAIEGTLYGGRSAAVDKKELLVQAQSSLDNEQPLLLQTLKLGAPFPLSDDLPDEVAAFFEALSGARGSVTEQDSPDSDWGGVPSSSINDSGHGITGTSTNDRNIGGNGGLDGATDKLVDKASGSPILLIVAGVIGGVVFVATIYYFFRGYYLRRKYQEDREAYRKKSKAERKLKRLSKDDSCDTLRKDAQKALEELGEEKDKDTPPESARPKSGDVDAALKDMREKEAKKKKKKSRSDSRRDTSSLPDMESMRRERSRSRSSERSSEKPSLLTSFLEEGKSKRKPGSRLSGTRSLDGDDFRRSAPARAFSDGPKSHSGDIPERKIAKSHSSDDLDQIRQSLNRRNKISPRSERRKMSELRQSRSSHARSFSGDLSGMAMRPSSRSKSGSGLSHSAHARPTGLDPGAGLYGSASPRRGTRKTRSGDVSSMRQSRSIDSASLRQNRSIDSNSTRQDRSIRLRDSLAVDGTRRGGRRRDASGMDGSQHRERGTPAQGTIPAKAKSGIEIEGSQHRERGVPARGTPSRAKSGNF